MKGGSQKSKNKVVLHGRFNFCNGILKKSSIFLILSEFLLDRMSQRFKSNCWKCFKRMTGSLQITFYYFKLPLFCQMATSLSFAISDKMQTSLNDCFTSKNKQNRFVI